MAAMGGAGAGAGQPIAEYNRPVRFAFELPHRTMEEILEKNILAPDQPEIGFIFYSHSRKATSPPNIIWNGTHFELDSELHRIEEHCSSPGLFKFCEEDKPSCSIIGCAPVSKKPGIYIIGHTHPKSIYLAYSDKLKMPLLFAPPSATDVRISIHSNCPLQCVFAVEGVYVIETLKQLSLREKEDLVVLTNEYDEFLNQLYRSVKEEYIAAATVGGERGIAMVNDIRRANINEILRYFNDRFDTFMQLRFHLWKPHGALMPSKITIKSFIPSNLIIREEQGNKYFSFVKEEFINGYTIEIDPERLSYLDTFVKELNILTPLDYLNHPIYDNIDRIIFSDQVPRAGAGAAGAENGAAGGAGAGAGAGAENGAAGGAGRLMFRGGGGSRRKRQRTVKRKHKNSSRRQKRS